MSNTNQNAVSLTPEQLKAILTEVVAAARQPNALEQRQLDEEVEKDKRRAQLSAFMAKQEMEAEQRRKDSCTHSRVSSGKDAGAPARRGEGEYTTGGQFVGDDGAAVLICTRCSYTWTWMPTKQERDYLTNKDFTGFAPPSDERCEEYRRAKEAEEAALAAANGFAEPARKA